MAGNPYTDRLAELSGKQADQNYKQLSKLVGIPISRPMVAGQGNVASPSGVPTGQAPLKQPDESYKDSAFWQNFDYHRQDDPHFDSFTGELTKLSTGLREQVKNGYMPPQIAQHRVQQFVMDSFLRRQAAAPHIEAQKHQAARQQSLGDQLSQLAQMATQNPTDDSEMAQAQQQQTPPVQNLSQPQPDAAAQGGMNGGA